MKKPSAKNKNSGLKAAFYKNRFTVLSLIIVLAMFGIVQFYHSEGGYRDWIHEKQVQSIGETQIGGPFTLTTMNGDAFTEADLLGKYSLVFFGFTFCPDICPDTLNRIADAYARLKPDMRNQLQVLFVSVDPQRDTPEKLKAYVEAFQPEFIGLTGTKAQLDEMTDAYLAYYTIRPPENINDPEFYMVDHSSFKYLMAPDGSYLTHFGGHTAPIELANKIESYMFQ